MHGVQVEKSGHRGVLGHQSGKKKKKMLLKYSQSIWV